MSPLLRVEETAAPLERAAAAVVAVAIFAERPLRDGAGRADWRLCGQLSELVVSGRLSGAIGEAVLVPTFGGLKAPLLLALGAGERAGFAGEACRAFACDAMERALGLRAPDLALALPETECLLRERALGALAGASLALAETGSDAVLKLLPSRGEAARLSAILADLRPDGIPPAVSLVLPGAAQRGRSGEPAVGRPAAAPGPR